MNALNRNDIIRMAQEAGLYTKCEVHSAVPFDQLLERFAALVEEAVSNTVHTCHAECQNPICVAVREAVAAEREECAKVCEGINSTKDYYGERVELVCAEAIRARGNDAPHPS